jgi:hypothetical protein
MYATPVLVRSTISMKATDGDIRSRHASNENESLNKPHPVPSPHFLPADGLLARPNASSLLYQDLYLEVSRFLMEIHLRMVAMMYCAFAPAIAVATSVARKPPGVREGTTAVARSSSTTLVREVQEAQGTPMILRERKKLCRERAVNQALPAMPPSAERGGFYFVGVPS